MSDETKITRDETADCTIPEGVKVYDIRGAMFFGAAGKVAEITADGAKTLIVRMESVPAMDATAMNSFTELHQRCEKSGVRLVFVHVNEQPMRTMEKTDFAAKIGAENFCSDMTKALALVK